MHCSKAASWLPMLSSIIDVTRPAVVLCQHGRARSAAGAEKLRAAGVADVKVRDLVGPPPPGLMLAQVLEGGLEGYASVDALVPTYPKYVPNFKF